MTVRTERVEDWASLTSALGGAKDKHVGITFARRTRLTLPELEALYMQNAIAARIVDKIVDDAFRTPWSVKVAAANGAAVDNDAIKARLDRAGFTIGLEQATRWSRLYGGAILAIAVTESGDPDQILAPTPASVLLRFVPIPAERARPMDQDVGFMSSTYGMVLRYQVTGIATAPVDLHYTRAIPFEPIKLPFEAQQREPGSVALGWGPSVLERPFDDLGRYGAAGAHTVSMMYSASLLVLKLASFAEECRTKDGVARLQKRLEATRRAMDSFGLTVMGQGDEMTVLSQQLSGGADLMDRTANRLAAATPYPREILFNESPAGLNAGELSGPQEIYFASVDAWRDTELSPAIKRAVEIDCKIQGIDVESIEVEFAPLWTRSDSADSEIYARNAAADATYIDKGVISADVVTRERFVKGKLGKIELAEDEAPEPLDLDPADVEAEEQAQEPARPPSTAPEPGDSVSPRDAALRYGVPTRTITRLMEISVDEGGLEYWGLGKHKRVSMAAVAARATAHRGPTNGAAAPA